MSSQRLLRRAGLRKSASMRIAPALLVALLAMAPPALAQQRAAAPGPKPLGTFQDWVAATSSEGGQPVCYAFTRAKPAGAVPGRGEVMLTVTQRAALRDAVSIAAGFAYAAKAEVKVEAGNAGLDFYTAQRSAFAREGARAVAAFTRAANAVAKSPGPRGMVTDSFSLKGFSAAYAAITKACPAK
jgi:hypothetical protein